MTNVATITIAAGPSNSLEDFMNSIQLNGRVLVDNNGDWVVECSNNTQEELECKVLEWQEDKFLSMMYEASNA